MVEVDIVEAENPCFVFISTSHFAKSEYGKRMRSYPYLKISIESNITSDLEISTYIISIL
jgi:hypothetical protein